MSMRLNYWAVAPKLPAMLGKLNEALNEEFPDHPLIHLVFLRASQINGCVFCIDMHVKEAVIDGERALRLHHVAAWRESPLFSDRERAALGWTEALTRLSPEDEGRQRAFEGLKTHFTDKEIVGLSMAVAIINGWNRLAIGFASTPGSADRLYGLDKAGLS